VLVSQSTRELASLEGLRDLGEHRLKDLSAPERLYQLGQDDFPPLKTLYRTNLPVPATAFLGRKRELGDIVALLAREDVRLLTLTGPGGTGKTRLALQAAAESADDYPDGVWWLPLASLRDPALVLPAVAEATGVKEEPGEALATTLSTRLAGKRMFLLLDNAEHLLPEVAVHTSRLVEGCPTVRALVTSRETLQVRSEREFPVPSLAPNEAILFFRERAAAHGVDLTDSGAVRELCLRLDELPLALELAAPRTKLFTLEQLLERLGQRLDLLKGSRDADPRQHTLRATIEWSHELLSDEEQCLFRRLAVFVGGCSYEAAESVCDADPDTLQSLLDKSLLRRRIDESGSARFWMLETIREYALERLETASEAASMRDRLAQWIAELVRLLAPALRRFESGALIRIAPEHGNVRAAVSWSTEGGDPAVGHEIVGNLCTYWIVKGFATDARTLAERVLHTAESVPLPVRLAGMTGASEIFRFTGDAARSTRLKEQVLTLLPELGDQKIQMAFDFGVEEMEIALLKDLAQTHAIEGDLDTAQARAEQALERSKQLDDAGLIAHSKYALGIVDFYAGRYGDAREQFATTLAHWEETTSLIEVGGTHLMLGECLRREGRCDDACASSRLHSMWRLQAVTDRCSRRHSKNLPPWPSCVDERTSLRVCSALLIVHGMRSECPCGIHPTSSAPKKRYDKALDKRRTTPYVVRALP
jgi:predicted ATPase